MTLSRSPRVNSFFKIFLSIIFQRKKEKKEAIRKEIEEKQAEIDRAKQAAETMFLGTNMPGDPGEPREATRRRQEIHWDYDKKGEVL